MYQIVRDAIIWKPYLKWIRSTIISIFSFRPLPHLTYVSQDELEKPSSGRPVTSGDTFKVRVETIHARKMKMAFDIQWALARIAAMTGAAETTMAGSVSLLASVDG